MQYHHSVTGLSEFRAANYDLLQHDLIVIPFSQVQVRYS